MRRATLLRFLLVVAISAAPHSGETGTFLPGERVLLDAHNAYPEHGKFTDRIDRALNTGLPVAIEQDLYWVRRPATGRYEAVVAHDSDATDDAPTFESYFLDRIAPLMERALAEPHREAWPL